MPRIFAVVFLVLTPLLGHTCCTGDTEGRQVREMCRRCRIDIHYVTSIFLERVKKTLKQIFVMLLFHKLLCEVEKFFLQVLTLILHTLLSPLSLAASRSIIKFFLIEFVEKAFPNTALPHLQHHTVCLKHYSSALHCVSSSTTVLNTYERVEFA
jgi:hypothetical protein